MNYVYGVFVFILGTIVGSFLNVVVYRYNSGLSPLTGRSRCFSCGKTLSALELIPLFSFIFSKGRCTSCESRLSWQYPAVELLTGLMFLFTAVHFQFDLVFLPHFVYFAVVWSLLIVIALYDLKHKIIPDGLVYTFALVSLASIFWFNFASFGSPGFFLRILAGPLFFIPFFLLWFISKGRWIGLGDGKLSLGIGWLLGLGQGGSAILIAFWIGAAVSIALLIGAKLGRRRQSGQRSLLFWLKKITIKSEIPFGPFLIFAVVLVFFFSINLFHEIPFSYYAFGQ